ncbi:L-rhamnose mutarotase [Niabella soli]|uniref:L-rhamnose mutarotase n=1 Tax=Niabella soli DSM 19437 TaxID=929713 RepID=W0EWF3_9BACT|nr:L-rhamnose mutarotase [Niabella soli]AHF15112.1 L-rhamnose mutarotase [Niabella soli DSM 19437]
MKRLAFKMKLFKGLESEYEKRHAAIWPELSALLKEQGITDYSIFWDRETNILFATMKITDPANLDQLPAHPVMKKWWDHMKDIMETHADHSPVSVPLKEVFYLP